MRVLVACECSGRVRDAFKAQGHDAWSCDLKDTLVPGQHIKGDVRSVLDDGWDLMVGHPDCTFLSVANNGPINHGCKWYGPDQAKVFRTDAIAFFMLLMEAPIERIAIENPIGIMSRVYRQPDQIIQPYDFGDDASKKTCLWLKNLPLLKPTTRLQQSRYANQTHSGQNRISQSCWHEYPGLEELDRKTIRSLTYSGIAKAMAEQWSVIDQSVVLEEAALSL